MDGRTLRAFFAAPIFLLAVSGQASAAEKQSTQYSEDFCTPNAVGHDVCETASNIARGIVSQLPMKMSQNLLLDKAYADKRTVHIHGTFSYNEDKLTMLANSYGVALEEMRQGVLVNTRNRACSESTGIKPFIGLGGEVSYHYFFHDGTEYLTVKVNSCK